MKLKLLFVAFIFATGLFGNENPYILQHDGLLDKRAREKIKQIGDETKQKLGVNLYVVVNENNGIDPELPRETRIKLMKRIEAKIIKDLKKPYAVLAISIDQMYANILLSDDLKNVIDKDDVLDGYVIPLLASKDKNTLFAKTSAAVLNGYAQMADSVAAYKNIKLQSSIGNEGKITGTVWKVFMYTMVVTGIVLYIVIIMREKKYKNMSKEELEKLEKDGK